MKKTPLDIPDNWPNPWKELGEGTVTLFGLKLLAWKKYKRRANFGIWGIARSYHYIRIWYGKKVLHVGRGGQADA